MAGGGGERWKKCLEIALANKIKIKNEFDISDPAGDYYNFCWSGHGFFWSF